MKTLSLAVVAFTTIFASCNSKQKETTQTPQVVVMPVDTATIQRNAIMAEQARVKADEAAKAKLVTTEKPVTTHSSTTTRHRSTTHHSSSNVGTSETPTGSGSGSETTTTTTTENKKTGWSDAAKGTVIGAGAGGIAGAIIDKGKGRGAVIGGLVGAGTGYVIGRAKDRKSGRVVKKTTTTTTNE